MEFAIAHEASEDGKVQICRGPVLPIPDIDAWIGPYFRFKCIYGCEQDELKLSKLELHMKECP
jgi:hypothetical protein